MQEQTDICVFIADDHDATVQRLSEFINATPGMKVVGTASDGKAVWEHFAAGPNGADVALVDIGMPEMDGLTAVGKIKSVCDKNLKVIVITGLHGRNYPAEAINRNADGFVSKSRSKDDFIDAINRVYRGEMVYFPDPDDLAQPPELPNRPPPLSPIETRVLCLVVQGLNTVQIADKIRLSEPNVDRIRRDLMHKLRVPNAAALGAAARDYELCR